MMKTLFALQLDLLPWDVLGFKKLSPGAECNRRF